MNRPLNLIVLALALTLLACGTDKPTGTQIPPDAGGTGVSEICDNKTDDDGDHKTDCADPDCFGTAACTTAEVCDNGQDDDADGDIDCKDSDCVDFLGCRSPEGAEICGNGKDDDADGLVDCKDTDCAADLSCAGKAEICDNSKDDDGDGQLDCNDGDCTGTAACPTGEICDNAKDDDADGKVDCADSDCASATVCQKRENCTNGADDDGDGQADCKDTDCAADPSCRTTTETDCTDGIDNDGDGKLDCSDSDCGGKTCGAGCTCTGSKPAETSCTDALDNDGDGNADCADSDCSADAACQGKSENCTDGIDNDGDRAIDCNDTDCASSTGCKALSDGKPCSADGQCASGKCLTEASGGVPQGYCSGTCTTAGAACPGGGICVKNGASTGLCYQKCTCTGTNCSNNGACRPGYACYDPSNSLVGGRSDFICIAQCDKDSQCAATGTGMGCNLWSGLCGKKDKGLAKDGAGCTSDASCESDYCYTDAGDGYPGGYCVSYCNPNSKICGGDARCIVTSSNTDAVATCYDGCTTNSNCRGFYACTTTSVGGVCFPTCSVTGGSCFDDYDCCNDYCSFSGICQ